MFEKNDKRRLYWLFDMYLSEKIDTWTLCDEYYFCYHIGDLDDETLTEKEKKAFHELSPVLSRFSPFKEDHIGLPNGFSTEEEVKKKVIETKKYLNK